jgi:hypothetical protein
MKKRFLGLILFIIGTSLGIYASRKNCLIALITRGEINLWTGIEILAGITALIGAILFLIRVRKK